MLYYRAKYDAHDYINHCGVVSGELLTSKERNSKVRYLGDEVFDIVAINKNQTYTSFGVRFPVTGAFVKVANKDGTTYTFKHGEEEHDAILHGFV